MTTLTLKNLTLPNPFAWIAIFLTSVSNAMAASRQIAVNEKIASQLLHEYPEQTYQSLLADLNERTIRSIYK